MTGNPLADDGRKDADAGVGTPRRPWLLLVPLAAFLGLAALFFVSLMSGDPSRLPSVLIGKPVPQFELPSIAGLKSGDKAAPGLSAADLARGKVSLVNMWASWCTPCVAEHPYLVELTKKSGVPLYGINYKDKADGALRFIERHGNPYAAIGADTTGFVAIDWGVTGVPETFVIDGQGRIAYRFVGPVTPEAIERDLLPAIARARG